jgi:hypothetical protein
LKEELTFGVFSVVLFSDATAGHKERIFYLHFRIRICIMNVMTWFEK